MDGDLRREREAIRALCVVPDRVRSLAPPPQDIKPSSSRRFDDLCPSSVFLSFPSSPSREPWSDPSPAAVPHATTSTAALARARCALGVPNPILQRYFATSQTSDVV
ncbi:hypothetical protein CIRG_00158 [Coccidioides immitis RMSCC 2394]|uniref:Uncharacterized protein n=1 Tax=Coccidioides immitis RMSCC 2394 TaxID=404692 RepID=A0A0J6XV50_COCIT|nr:hypothetical protein CIRG_00158 [Coccidioides immitis RMSCC 2394]